MDYTQRPTSVIEYGFAFVALLVMIGALAPIYTSYAHLYSGLTQNIDPTGSNLEFQLLTGSIYLVSLALLLRHRAAAVDVIIKNKGLLAFIGLLLISSVWAQDPLVSLRRSLALTGTTMFAIYVSVRFPPYKFLALLTAAMIFVVFETIFVSLFFPFIGVHSGLHDGAWRGVFGHKNTAGRTLVFAALTLWVYGGLPASINVKIAVRIVLALCLGLIVLTTSGTSLVVLLSLILGVAVLRLLRRSSINLGLRITVVSLLVLLPLVFLGLSFFEQGLELLGRDATLTGRTQIWEGAVEIGSTRPLLGFGYRSFWTNQNLSGALTAGHGHNSFLDLWLEVGFIGMGVFAVTYFSAIRRAFWRSTQSRDSLGRWYILFLLAFTVFASTGKVFPDQGSIEWVLYVLVLVHLAPNRQPLRTPGVAQPLAT